MNTKQFSKRRKGIQDKSFVFDKVIDDVKSLICRTKLKNMKFNYYEVMIAINE